MTRRSDVAALRCLLVARVDHRIERQRRQQDHALDQVLAGVAEVQDGHAVDQDADQHGADKHVAHPALAARQADPAQHDDEQHVIDQRRIVEPGVDARDEAGEQDPGEIGDQRGDDILRDQHRPRRQPHGARGMGVVAGRIDEAAKAGEPQEGRHQRREREKDRHRGRQAKEGARANEAQPGDIRRRIEHIRAERDPAAAIDHRGHGQGGEDRRDLGHRDQQPGDQPADRHQPAADHDRTEKPLPERRKPDREGDADDHHRDHRQVDAAPDDDEAHPGRERAQDRDILQQRKDVALGQEVVEKYRKHHEEKRGDRGDDAFLRDLDAPTGTGRLRGVPGHVLSSLDAARRGARSPTRLRPACPPDRIIPPDPAGLNCVFLMGR
ncbi:hypothetical protein SDC9_26418 [bioreactor metagenome]|uniref:Uncharacterized protein n=1 Tax=bioreactor metagenome TaxID=1076179 RepID=A0A644UND0_9ZZZZ